MQTGRQRGGRNAPLLVGSYTLEPKTAEVAPGPRRGARGRGQSRQLGAPRRRRARPARGLRAAARAGRGPRRHDGGRDKEGNEESE